MFAIELAAVIQRLAQMPTVGEPYGVGASTTVRRVLMPRTQTHLYYAVDRSRRLVVVLAIWGARKGHGPPL